MQKHQQRSLLTTAADPHIDSFNHIYEDGLSDVLNHLTPMQISDKDLLEITPIFTSLKVGFQQLRIGKPYRNNEPSALIQEIYPLECRMAGKTYCASLLCELFLQIDGVVESFTASLGDIPIMVKSLHCHLSNLSQSQLVQLGEDPNQFGGYFIVNGKQKVIRMLIIAKRNYPIAFIRTSYCNRGPGYTQFAVQMRCVREDFYSKTITLHYISDGNVFLRILYKKQQFLIPLIILLKALSPLSDRQIYLRLMQGNYTDTDRSSKIQVLIKARKSLQSQSQCLSYIGRNFRLLLNVSNTYNDKEAGEIFLSENICVHIVKPIDKFHTLALMVDKLYKLVAKQISPQNLDSLCTQEALLPGHLYQMIIKEKLEEQLSFIRAKIIKDMISASKNTTITNNNKNTSNTPNASNKNKKVNPMKKQQVKELNFINIIKKGLQAGIVGKSLAFFLATGTLKSKTGLDLMQDKGFCIIGDRLNNMRFLSHFRSIHRGAYFTQMKTTTVRKLLPQSWGFLCPVHTPDGAPCGLLNHITLSCIPLSKEPKSQTPLSLICQKYHMILLEDYNYIKSTDCYPILINGCHIGYVQDNHIQQFVSILKRLKIQNSVITNKTQIAFLKKGTTINTVYPMVCITTASGRFLRPIYNNTYQSLQYISPLEQIFLDIDLPNSQYSQLSKSYIFSILPQHIPFMNYNQSPRNMYQCQMAKQTLGTSVLNWQYRYDNKLYRLLMSQIPLVRNNHYDSYKFNDYNSGTNAIVAVLSYTGYDMEDAMIINKSSFQMGFGRGLVYKTIQYVLCNEAKNIPKYKLFKDAPVQMQKMFQLPNELHSDGICKVGGKLKKYSSLLVVYDVGKKAWKTFYNKEAEPCSVEGVVICGGEQKHTQKVLIKLRFNRRPVIGDKFSSRHGQKGVLSMLWPKIDMPFTQSGMTPDIIINPHAFPSRMTIGMLIQSMAAKSAALDGTPVKYDVFQCYQNDNVVDYFGHKLLNKGFNFYGNETMYSGTYGTVLNVDIFIGVVYYQRLRHMVHDKSQARSTGPVDSLTQQPLKGRKKGGGIRLGEMERDALLAHGVSQVINERLFKTSDKSLAYICCQCGMMLGCYKNIKKVSGQNVQVEMLEKTVCNGCKANNCSVVAVPYVMKYLVTQLAAMNINLRFKLKQ